MLSLDKPTNRNEVGTLVIGGGQAGLAVGYHLRVRGLPFVIVADGFPIHERGIAALVPVLYFMGLLFQYSLISALREPKPIAHRPI